MDIKVLDWIYFSYLIAIWIYKKKKFPTEISNLQDNDSCNDDITTVLMWPDACYSMYNTNHANVYITIHVA